MKESLIITEFKKSLLGRIKLKTASLITGKLDTLPTPKQSSRFWKNEVEGKPSFWTFFLHSIIVNNRTYPIAYSEIINSEESLENSFKSLSKNFTERVVNFTVYDCPLPLCEELIVWIIKDDYVGKFKLAPIKEHSIYRDINTAFPEFVNPRA